MAVDDALVDTGEVIIPDNTNQIAKISIPAGFKIVLIKCAITVSEGPATGIQPVFVRVALVREGENERNFTITSGYCYVYDFSGLGATIAIDMIWNGNPIPVGKANPEPGNELQATFHNNTGTTRRGILTAVMEKRK